MGFILFDASGLSKRYSEEDGAETVEAVFAGRGGHTFISTPWGYLETFAVLLRRKNNRLLSQAAFNIASDKRLIRSALAENLAVLNPEEILPAAVPALLAALS